MKHTALLYPTSLTTLALLAWGCDPAPCADGYGMDADGNCVSLYEDPSDTGSAAGDDTGASTGDDTGTSTGEAVPAADINAWLAEDIVTVVKVSWTTASATTGYVEFGETTDYGHTTPATESGTEHEVWLLGMPAETEVHFRVITDTVGVEGASVSADQTITTGILPSELPELTVSGESPSTEGYMIAPIQGSAFAIAILDNQGRYVWYDLLEQSGNLMRAMISGDGEHMIYCLAGGQENLEDGKVRWVSLDGAEETDVAWPYVDHDLTELPDGTVAAIVVTQDPSGGIYQADRIVEMTRDGVETEVWSAWNETDFDYTDLQFTGTNWTHGNALDYDPVEDAYYFSAKEIGTIFKIDRATGETLWKLNGQLNEFTFETGVKVEMQHQFQILDDGAGIVIFDNGEQDRGYSRAVEYTLDQENLIANEVWEYIRDPPIYVYAKGDVERWPNGDTRVVWSTQGEVQDVSPDGEVVWQLNSELGGAITFVQNVDDLYGR